MQGGSGGPLKNYYGPLIFRYSPVTRNKVDVANWEAVWPVLRTTALRHFDPLYCRRCYEPEAARHQSLAIRPHGGEVCV